ncbi:MAG: hypothetical protein K6E33_04615 [Lachnospiraceae bacterium]|nr:hypothetical protein [Lachnospiraceae bacterium]
MRTQRDDRYLTVIASIAVTLFCVIFTMSRYEIYYDMNDDVLIKDILAGVYTGIPEGLNIQMLSPLSFLISLFYRMAPTPDWYAVFLLFTFFVSLFLVTERVLLMVDGLPAKAVSCLAVVLSYLAFSASRVVFMQYTVVSGFVMSSAIFLLCTESNLRRPGALIKTGFMCGLAFALRSEMALFLLPILLLGVLFNRIMRGEGSIKKYLSDTGLIAAFVAVIFFLLFSLDALSYSGKDWREFRAFFRARTELYDYQQIPSWKSAQDMYGELGLDSADVEVLKNYNFGIDDRITTDVMSGVSEYAASLKPGFAARLKETFYVYFRQVLPGAEYRNSTFTVLVLYAAVIYGFIADRRYLRLLMCPALFVIRSALWLYLIYVNRYPERVTFSLFLAEAFVLLAIALTILKNQKRDKRFTFLVYSVVCLLSLFLMVPVSDSAIRKEMLERTYDNSGDDAINDYCEAHPDVFYFEDVYSTVNFSERMPGDTLGRCPMNCAIMGGWACKSPLWDRKLKGFGIEDPFEALLSGKAQFICRLDRDVDWLSDFCASRGYRVNVRRIAGIMGTYGVYRIE